MTTRTRRPSRTGRRPAAKRGTDPRVMLIFVLMVCAGMLFGGALTADKGGAPLMWIGILGGYLAGGPLGVAWVASKLGREGAIWFFLGLIFPVLSFVVLFIVGEKSAPAPARRGRR